MDEMEDPRPSTWSYRALASDARVIGFDGFADDREARAWGAQLARELDEDVTVERHGLDGWVDIEP